MDFLATPFAYEIASSAFAVMASLGCDPASALAITMAQMVQYAPENSTSTHLKTPLTESFRQVVQARRATISRDASHNNTTQSEFNDSPQLPLSENAIRKTQSLCVKPCVDRTHIYELVTPKDLCVIHERLGALLNHRIRSDIFKKWLHNVKKDARDHVAHGDYIFASVSIFEHIAEKIWGDDRLCHLHDLTRSGDASRETAARVRLLAWLYFKRDLLSPNSSDSFPTMGDYVTSVEDLVSFEEREVLCSDVLDIEFLDIAASRDPCAKFRHLANTSVSHVKCFTTLTHSMVVTITSPSTFPSTS